LRKILNLLVSKNAFLIKPEMPTEFFEPESDHDAENAHLISQSQPQSHDLDEEKLNTSGSSKLHSSRKLWPPQTRIVLVTLLSITSILTTLISIIIVFIFNSKTPALPNPGSIFGDCGSSPSSALAADCIFDPLSFSWLPQSCADLELTSQFLGLKNWTWWVDQERKDEVGVGEVMKGEYKALFVTREYHMLHCTYMWRKMHRGMMLAQSVKGNRVEGSENGNSRAGGQSKGRGIIDTYIGSYAHTAHCEMMLLGMEGEEGGVDKNATDTAILMKFPRCMWV
jgi:hypothetical protein